MLDYNYEDLDTNITSWEKLIHPDDAEQVHARLDALINGKVPVFNEEYRARTRSGEWRWVLDIAKVIEWDSAGQALQVAGTIQEVSERKQMEETLCASENRYRSFFENSLIGIFESSPDGRYLNCNQAFATMLGFASVRELIESTNNSGEQFYNDPQKRKEFLAVLERQEYATNFIHAMHQRDGSPLWLLSNSLGIRNDSCDITHYEGVCIDITALITAQNAVKASEENLQSTLDSIGDAVISTDTERRIVRMNPVAETLTGWARTEAIGQPLSRVFHAQNRETKEMPESTLYKTLESGEIVRFSDNTELVSKDGRKALIAVSTAPIRDAAGAIDGAVLIFRDFTEEHYMHEQMQRVHQLEQIGTLAGGIAHDFNNILAGVFGNLELITELVPNEHPAVKYLEQTKNSAERARNLTNQLLTFAKGGEPIKGAVDLSNMIRDIARFDLSGSKVKLQFTQAPELHQIAVDGSQIQQVISNLVINGAQAMPNGGHLHIELKNHRQEQNQEDGSTPGDYIQISVHDEGDGIDEELLPRIFDPYFSTKHGGRGLGLATVHSVIARHNGHIRVASKKGFGTTFFIYLPASGLNEQPQQAEEEDKQIHREQNDLNILLMDDELIVRETATDMLSFLGHRPQTATKGEEALRLYRKALESDAPFDLVILDLTIPGGMGGKETLQELLTETPELRAIVSSGYADDPIMAHCTHHGFKCIAKKPYSMAQLKQSINQAMQ
jgi:PAS domain S-box-containing protein